MFDSIHDGREQDGREIVAPHTPAQDAPADREVPTPPPVLADAPGAGAARAGVRRRIDCTAVDDVPRWVGTSGRRPSA